MVNYFKEFWRIYGDRGILGMCFLARTAMPVVYGTHDLSKPILYVYGDKDTGKTEFIKSLFKTSDISTMSINVLDVHKYFKVDSLIPGISHIDDINEPLDSNFIECIKGGSDPLYKRFMIISGREDLRGNTSLFSRTVFLDFNGPWSFKENRAKDFEVFRFIRDHALINKFDVEHSTHKLVYSIHHAQKIIKYNFPTACDRVRENYIALLAGYFYFQDIFPANEQGVINTLLVELDKQNEVINQSINK